MDFGVEECGELSWDGSHAIITICCHHHRYLALYALRRQQIDIGRAMHIVRVSVKDHLVEFIYRILDSNIPAAASPPVDRQFMGWVILLKHHTIQQSTTTTEQHTYHKKRESQTKKHHQLRPRTLFFADWYSASLNAPL